MSECVFVDRGHRMGNVNTARFNVQYSAIFIVVMPIDKATFHMSRSKFGRVCKRGGNFQNFGTGSKCSFLSQISVLKQYPGA